MFDVSKVDLLKKNIDNKITNTNFVKTQLENKIIQFDRVTELRNRLTKYNELLNNSNVETACYDGSSLTLDSHRVNQENYFDSIGEIHLTYAELDTISVMRKQKLSLEITELITKLNVMLNLNITLEMFEVNDEAV